MSGARPPENPTARQLHIKLGVVQRTQKELASYHKELAQNKARVEAMQRAGGDEYDIKKQVRRRLTSPTPSSPRAHLTSCTLPRSRCRARRRS